MAQTCVCWLSVVAGWAASASVSNGESMSIARPVHLSGLALVGLVSLMRSLCVQG